MKINFITEDIDSAAHRCLLVLANKSGETINGSEKLAGLLQPFVASGEFGKNFGGSVYLANPAGITAQRVLFFNIGDKVGKTHDLRRATARAWKGLSKRGYNEILFGSHGFENDEHLRAAFEGLVFGDYQYTDLKTEKEKLPSRLETVNLTGDAQVAAKITRWNAIAEGTLRARDLSQTPANILTPRRFAELASEWAPLGGSKVTVMDDEQCRTEGMGAMLAVGQGSAEESKFIIMDYQPANPSGKTIVLVGKAVTFDSGGLSLKPSNMMAEMKGDMGGGAAVVGIMSVLKQADCRHRVIGLVPAVENMPSAAAIKPSDVVTSLSGLTIEINNTDAEGRLIMADALAYAARYNPDYVIDYATLTGACLMALGPKVCGVMGNHQPLVEAIVRAGDKVHEPFWQLPLG